MEQIKVLKRLTDLGVPPSVAIHRLGQSAPSNQVPPPLDPREAYDRLMDRIMSAIDSSTDVAGEPLAESLTVVVLSEMGRYPQLNTRGGREHWTFTSGMLIGSGVRGGQVIGGYDDYAAGQPTSLDSGQVDDSGEYLVTGHVGATLLALADIDPAEHLAFDPIRAALVDP